MAAMAAEVVQEKRVYLQPPMAVLELPVDRAVRAAMEVPQPVASPALPVMADRAEQAARVEQASRQL